MSIELSEKEVAELLFFLGLAAGGCCERSELETMRGIFELSQQISRRAHPEQYQEQ